MLWKLLIFSTFCEHWFLAVVMVQERFIAIFDSMADDESILWTLEPHQKRQGRFDGAVTLLNRIFVAACPGPDFSQLSVETPMQPIGDTHSCGLMLIEFVSRIVTLEPVKFGNLSNWFNPWNCWQSSLHSVMYLYMKLRIAR